MVTPASVLRHGSRIRAGLAQGQPSEEAVDEGVTGGSGAEGRSRANGVVGSGGGRRDRGGDVPLGRITVRMSTSGRCRRAPSPRFPGRGAPQTLELLTGRFDVGPVDRVRLPAPAGAVVGQVDGPAAREDGEAGRCAPIDEGNAAGTVRVREAGAPRTPRRPRPARTRRRGASVRHPQEVINSRRSSTASADDDAVAGRRHGRGRCGAGGVCVAVG